MKAKHNIFIRFKENEYPLKEKQLSPIRARCNMK